MDPLRRADLERLTVKELRACTHGRLRIPVDVGKRKESLVSHILDHAYGELQAEIEKAVFSKGAGRGGKRRSEEEHDDVTARNPPHVVDNHDPNHYLDLPTQAEVNSLYRDFYNATSNHAVRRVVCGVCAREWGSTDADVKLVNVKDITNPNRLKPEVPHPAHDLYDGMLLHPDGVYVDDASMTTIVNICSGCRDELRQPSPSPLSFSLANGLWIGAVPKEIKSLTFLEQLLVAHIRTKCYVFKLWPKNARAGLDSSTMQRAMRGTVTSYDLNVPGAYSVVSDAIGDIWSI